MKNKLLNAVRSHIRQSLHIEAYNKWCEEWVKFKTSGATDFVGLPDREFDVDPEDLNEGDILMLSPNLIGQGVRPFMVMVLAQADSDSAAKLWGTNFSCAVVTPFSPLSKPAFSYELSIDEDRILQLWNTRCVPPNHLKMSWRMGQADQETVDAAYDVHLHYEGKPLSKELSNRVFVPEHGDDLKLHTEYYNSECELADNLEL